MSRKFALVIGNTEYTDPGLAQLTAPRNDATDFARVLKDPQLCAFDEVRVILNEPSSSVTEAVDEFFDQKKPDDLLLLYFSGHGMRDELGSLYLAFKNTIRSRLRATAIKSDYIREAMDQSRSKRQVVILDCCNSGAFPQGTKADVGGPMGLGSALEGYGRFVLMASDATQFAWEGDKVIGSTPDSLFTHFLVKGLEGEADRDADGRITVDELYDYAYEEIAKVTEKQTPTKAAAKVKGEFVLRAITRLEDIKPVPLPPDIMDEVQDTRPYVREAVVQKLERILKGRNIGMARSALAALERIAADDNTTRRVAQAASQALESYHQSQREAAQAGETLQEAQESDSSGTLETPLPPEEPEMGGQPAPLAQDTRRDAPASDHIAAVPLQKPAGQASPQIAVGSHIMPEVQARPAGQGRKMPWIWIGGAAALAIGLFALWGVLTHAPSVPTPAPTDIVAADTATSVPPTLESATTAPVPASAVQVPATDVVPVTGGPHLGTKDESAAAWQAGVPTLRDKATEKYSAADNASPTTLTYHVLLRQSDEVRWEWFWCSLSQSILDDNLNNLELHFVLDGQDVTSQFINADFENGGWQCRMTFIVLSKWPAGSYHLTTTLTIIKTINDGSSDYIAGDYIDDYTVNVK